MRQDSAPGISVLFEHPEEGEGAEQAGQQPTYFGDLHLDQVVAAALVGREEYALAPFFYSPLSDAGAVRYRQEVLKDLEKPEVAACVLEFAERMRWARRYLSGMEKLEYAHYREGWFLDAAENYCVAVSGLLEGLGSPPVASRGLRLILSHMDALATSDGFVALASQVRQLRAELPRVDYCLFIRGRRVTVSSYEDEPDYSGEIGRTFAKFMEGGAKDYRAKFRDQRSADHVHAQVLQRVARLYPDLFARLKACYLDHQGFIDPAVARFDREVQFYLAYLELVEKLREAGLPFCYPEVSTAEKTTHVEQAFDIALAALRVKRGLPVVKNDIDLEGPERLLVVTGPNQGGKTTFARMFGQLHFLAGLGLLVPGAKAQLFLPDRVFSHFERSEHLDSLRGKLMDELVRTRDILDRATSQSVVVMNESFSSTSLEDARFIGTEVLGRLSGLGALGVYVTFVDELASLNETTVSMVAEADPADPDVRTYKVTRRPADGRAYAMALARKYRLTSTALRERVLR